MCQEKQTGSAHGTVAKSKGYIQLCIMGSYSHPETLGVGIASSKVRLAFMCTRMALVQKRATTLALCRCFLMVCFGPRDGNFAWTDLTEFHPGLAHAQTSGCKKRAVR